MSPPGTLGQRIRTDASRRAGVQAEIREFFNLKISTLPNIRLFI
jgi:hypothetical protein